MPAHRLLAEVWVATGIPPDDLLAHPDLLEHVVDVLSERTRRV